MYAILAFIISLLLTAIIYGIGHVLLVRFRKRPITKKRLRVYCVLYDMAVHFLFIVVNSLLYSESTSNTSPAILWWIIWYNFAARQLESKGLLLEHPVAIPADQYNRQETEMRKNFQGYVVDESTGEVLEEPPAQEVVMTYQQPEENAAPPQPSAPSKRRFQRSHIVFSAVCAVLMVCIGVLGYHTYRMDETVKALTAENTELNQKNETLEEEKDALVKEKASLRKEKTSLEDDLTDANARNFDLWYQLYQIGFIVDGSPYYHYFECDIYTSADSYLAHNTAYCEAYGYKKCPLCWK